MRVRQNRPRGTLVVMAVMVIGLGVLIWKVPPERWWVEIGAVATMGVILWFLGAWITRARKWGWIISLAGVGCLIMSRFQILDWVTVSLMLVAVGLITLIN
ncbi:hypothetical protein A3H89_05490 [Candidatus Amesbacteria bacterium RIFCSPLOWO2_02_FULL_48_11]|uniref:Uncharacterized protein n=4 Tax=Candidatus Amesiibacteriota TaxID=1752730 RepID=A0A1F4Z9N7_9BACT|nr:MAG: hypothetical protein UX78_C0002G0032 [Candidatus Amesbacteria bacterium GW2011_GWA2_47_11]KKU92656.1 MAG: hypothetical protein UY22_C0029G0013 [Candidatus Amesbacteria bacterium GW2011_GWC1_48_10]KKW00836.1 MAG: hypothetical protein UY33_C0004G0022 [Candidatus Amesbacteria bacterium GW2011_GWA1_48_9]OGC90412.1 MAG: hypothetical protein A2V48_04695 [Candidatus Amesbacteria bacterium RBG_19FT_COMBO_48_16]OGC97001.1 MAG: hypothetical protein A3C34_00290 [Candidatus Amesbacteria bacterium R